MLDGMNIGCPQSSRNKPLSRRLIIIHNFHPRPPRLSGSRPARLALRSIAGRWRAGGSWQSNKIILKIRLILSNKR